MANTLKSPSQRVVYEGGGGGGIGIIDKETRVDTRCI